MTDIITIKGARENNLKNISLDIPKHQLVVLTGPSGSGKSTLALDILQRECQRQYMESSGMASDTWSKPKVESIVGLSPSIGVGQQITNRNPRSTVGTVTDMYTYLRLIYEKLGERTCPKCQTKVKPQLENNSKEVHIFEEVPDYTEYVYCSACNHKMKRLSRSHFSFNKPEGACETCGGLGEVAEINTKAVFNEDLSISDGAVLVWYDSYMKYQVSILEVATKYYDIPFDADLPLKEHSVILRDLLYYGVESEIFSAHFPDVKAPKTVSTGNFEGVLTGIWRRYKEKDGDTAEAALFFKEPCHNCDGERLKEESRLVKVAGSSITEIAQASLKEMLEWLTSLQGKIVEDESIIETVLHDLIVKVTRVIDVGLGYLSMDRQAVSLSGGEAQRLRLASILGSGLTGVLYILDEPTAGLHPKDTKGLVKVMKQLRDLGNTVLVIEHSIQVMQDADHIIDMGPGAGQLGGTIVGEGRLQELEGQEDSVTGAHLRESSFIGKSRRKGTGHQLTIYNAYKHNLKNITVSLPLGCFVTVAGVSGSGKSTLLYDLLASGMNGNHYSGCEKITGFDEIEKMITVDQSPLSRMRRSNVATYTDVFTFIRNLFSKLPEAKQNNLTAKDFSFNTTGGRCEKCEGLGVVSVNMHFLPDLEARCPACHGKRFKDEILTVAYKEHTISDILNMSIEESLPLFDDQKKISKMIHLLNEVGLGYLQWGQSLTTLSGGEGQRIKLAKELSKQNNGHTLYLLDEPSTGLHPSDVKKLLVLLNKLVDAGNTIIVVEHNSDIIVDSDWVIDIGPEGGEAGGEIVAEGTPEEVATVKASHTGAFLRF